MFRRHRRICDESPPLTGSRREKVSRSHLTPTAVTILPILATALSRSRLTPVHDKDRGTFFHKRFAVARPIPLPPPVMTATLAFSFDMFSSPSVLQCETHRTECRLRPSLQQCIGTVRPPGPDVVVREVRAWLGDSLRE